MAKIIADVLINDATTEQVSALVSYLWKAEHLGDDQPDYTEAGEPAGGFAQQMPSSRRPGYTQCWLWGSDANIGKLKAGEQEPLVFWVVDV